MFEIFHRHPKRIFTASPANSHVIHQNVQFTELHDGPFHEIHQIRIFRHVTFQSQSPVPHSTYIFSHLFGCRQIHVTNHHISSRLCQNTGTPATDTITASRHKSYHSRQVQHFIQIHHLSCLIFTHYAFPTFKVTSKRENSKNKRRETLSISRIFNLSDIGLL